MPGFIGGMKAVGRKLISNTPINPLASEFVKGYGSKIAAGTVFGAVGGGVVGGFTRGGIGGVLGGAWTGAKLGLVGGTALTGAHSKYAGDGTFLNPAFFAHHGRRMAAGAAIGAVGGGITGGFTRGGVGGVLGGAWTGAQLGAIGGLGSSLWSHVGGYQGLAAAYGAGAAAPGGTA